MQPPSTYACGMRTQLITPCVHELDQSVKTYEYDKQECIPVGCVPSAAVAAGVRWGVSQHALCRGCVSQHALGRRGVSAHGGVSAWEDRMSAQGGGCLPRAGSAPVHAGIHPLPRGLPVVAGRRLSKSVLVTRILIDVCQSGAINVTRRIKYKRRKLGPEILKNVF